PLPTAICFSFSHPPPTRTYTLSLHDALPIFLNDRAQELQVRCDPAARRRNPGGAEEFGSNDLISRGQAPRIGIEQPCALGVQDRSEEHTSELQSRGHLVCRLLLEKKKTKKRR